GVGDVLERPVLRVPVAALDAGSSQVVGVLPGGGAEREGLEVLGAGGGADGDRALPAQLRCPAGGGFGVQQRGSGPVVLKALWLDGAADGAGFGGAAPAAEALGVGGALGGEQEVLPGRDPLHPVFAGLLAGFSGVGGSESFGVVGLPVQREGGVL